MKFLSLPLLIIFTLFFYEVVQTFSIKELGKISEFIELIVIGGSLIALFFGKKYLTTANHSQSEVYGKTYLIWFSIIILTAQLIILYYKIQSPITWSDEATSFLLSTTNDSLFPYLPSGYLVTSNWLYYLCTYLFDKTISFRVLSLGFYLGTTFFIYKLISASISREYGIFAALLFLTVPNFFEIAYYMRPYMMAIFFYVLFIYLYLYPHKGKIFTLFITPLILIFAVFAHMGNMVLILFFFSCLLFDRAEYKRHLVYILIFFMALLCSYRLLDMNYINHLDRVNIDQLMPLKLTGIYPLDYLQEKLSHFLPINLVPTYYSNYHRIFAINPLLALLSIFFSTFLIIKPYFLKRKEKILITFFIFSVFFFIFGKTDIYLNRGYIWILILMLILSVYIIHYIDLFFGKKMAIFILSLFVILQYGVIYTTYGKAYLGNHIYAHFNIWDGINYIPDSYSQYQFYKNILSKSDNPYIIITTDVPEIPLAYKIRPDYFLSTIPVEFFKTDGELYHYYSGTPYIQDIGMFKKILSDNRNVILFTSFSLDSCKYNSNGKIYPELFHIDCRVIDFLKNKQSNIVYQSPMNENSRIYLFP